MTGAELRQSVRSLARSPGFSAAVLLTLALGIGANTAVYSVVRAVILRPLPYPEPDRLVFLAGDHRPDPMGEEVAPATFLDWRRESRSFERLGAFGPATVNLVHDGIPERLQAAQITSGALEAVGARPLVGRLFLPGEERPDSRVAILSYGLWQSRFAGDPNAVGKTVRLSDVAYPIVGVMPREFRFPSADVQLWIPLRITPARAVDRQSRWLYVVGRLRKGATLGAAQREMDAVTASLARQYPKDSEGWGARLERLRDHMVGRVRPALWILLATALLVLATACANVANLSLARASGRRAEMAVRAALGGSSSDLARPLFVEAALLTLGGGAGGVLLARTTLRGFAALAPLGIPRLDEVRIDAAVLAFTLLASVLTVFAFGLLPALSARRLAVADGLRRGGRGAGTGGGHLRGRRLLTAAELASAAVLLVGAGLLLASLSRLSHVAPGFSAEHVLTMEVVLPRPRYDDARSAAFFRKLAERAARLPGVGAAAGVSHLPLGGANSTDGYLVEGRPPANPNETPEAAVRAVTPGYFAALAIPLRAGRDFSPRDTASSPPVVVVNRAFARLNWPDADAVGKRLLMDDAAGRRVAWEIVGVVGDIHHARLELPPVPEIYVCYEQKPYDAMTLVLRSSQGIAGLAAQVRAEVARLDPDEPVSVARTMESVVEEATSQPRFYTTLLAAFAALALLLASVGIYGLIAYSVAQRRREIGVRMALGARPSDVLGLIAKEGALLAAAGIGSGLLVAAAVSRGMSGLLFGVEARDPLVFAAAAGVLASVAMAASLGPAARAARTAPVEALRAE